MRKWIPSLLLTFVIILPTFEKFLPSSAEPVIRIGLQAPLSGPQSTQGGMLLKGAMEAIKEQQAWFKAHHLRLELMPVDDQSSTVKGLQTAVRLCNEPTAAYSIGPYQTGIALAEASTFERCKLTMISPSTTGDELTAMGKANINRTCAPDGKIATALAEYAFRQAKVRTLAIVQDKTAYGEGAANSFASSFQAQGGKILASEGIAIGDQDFSGPLNSILASHPEAIFYGGLYTEFGIFYRQAREKGFTGKFFAGEAIDSPELIPIAGPHLTGVYYATISGDLHETQAGQRWMQKFLATNHIRPEASAYNAYTATSYAVQVLQRLITDPRFRAHYAQNPAEVRSAFSSDGSLHRSLVVRATRGAGLYENATGSRVLFDEHGENREANVFIRYFGSSTYPGKILGRGQ